MVDVNTPSTLNLAKVLELASAHTKLAKHSHGTFLLRYKED